MKTETLISMLARPMTWRQIWRAAGVSTIELDLAIRAALKDRRIVQEGSLYRRHDHSEAQPDVSAAYPIEKLADVAVTFEGGTIRLKPRTAP